MIYSLINVTSRNTDNTVNGYWIQDCTGTLEQAKERAKATNQVNGNKLEIVITESVSCPVAILNYWTNLVEIA